MRNTLQARVGKSTGPTDSLWQDFETDRKACRDLIRECLAFVEGSLMRQKGFDNGLCSIADALLRQFNESAELGWNSFTLPADGESFEGLAEVIRLRFPITGIWDLPIAAHEFGHFASTKLKPAAQPREDYTGFQSDAIAPFFEELFADAFGTFALGPAFVRTCLFRRFPPAAANEQSDGKHPTFATRAYLILAVLKQMGRTVKGYTTIVALSAERWRALTQAAQQPIMKENKELDTMARDCYRFLRSSVPRLEYTSWPAAQSLSSELAAPGDLKGYSLADALNAAWIARLVAGSNSQEISQRAIEVSKKIAEAE